MINPFATDTRSGAALDARLRKNLDLPLIVLTLLVVALGIVTLYSVSRDASTRYYQKQMVFCFFGLVAMGAAASLDYTRLPTIARTLYFTNLGLLIIVMKFTPKVKGAQRWIPLGGFQFQPSEFAKLVMIICLAVFLVSRLERIRELPVLLSSLGYVGVPMLLIFKQPDLGTALVLMAIWFGMTFIAGAQIKHLLALIVIGSLLFAGMWKFNVLKPYQKDRMAAFINPDWDPKDAGYHVRQSRIAVGSGEVWGKGLGKGTQAHGRFIPENHTDFVFTVIGEEGGFVACVLLVVLYGGMLMRGAFIMAHAEDALGKLIATGVVSMYAFHIIENIGMTLGIMPVAGVPLPLFSYGGSNLLLNLTAIGLLLSIGMRRGRLVF